MARYTLGLAEVQAADMAEVGGKAAGLGALIRAGLPVPDGFVVTTSAYRDTVGVVRGDDASARIRGIAVPDAVTRDVLGAYHALDVSEVAVRSSATAEDLAGASFAGQYDTSLRVTGEGALLRALRDCWASLWSPRAVGYRARHAPGRTPEMAVVVQAMVDAEWSGTLFTADPVTGRRDVMVVETVRGDGQALVSGAATGVRHVLEKRTGAIAEGDGVLPHAVLAELCRHGRRVEDAAGRPQDIEWVYADGRCVLVQARPITALPEADRRGPTREGLRRRGRGRFRNIWLVAAEHAPVPPYPMDASLFLRPAVAAALRTLRGMGLATPAVDDVVVGVEQGAIVVDPPRPRPTPALLYRLPAALPRVVGTVARARPGAWIDECEATLVPLLDELERADLAALPYEDLIAQMLRLRRVAGPLFPTRFACFPRGRLADAALRGVLRVAVGRRRARQVHADLLSDVACITLDAHCRLRRLAATIRASTILSEIYRSTDARDIAGLLAETAEGRAVLADVDDYLDRFGLWKTSTPSVGLPALRDAPHAVHGQLTGLVPAASDTGDAAPQQRHTRALDDVAAGGVIGRICAALAGRLSVHVRQFVGFREDSHYHLYAIFAVARRHVLDVGRRMVEHGALDRPDDVLFLELPETAEAAWPRARGVVDRRRRARAATLPEYEGIGPALTGWSNTPELVRGTPANQGVATGRVRIVRGEAEFGKLRHGDVLVCPHTNPAWTPLFGVATAVVVDMGGTTSHSAIVAREYGIPAVMGTGDGTSVLSDGAWVRVDGERGTVTRAADAHG